MPAKLLSRRSLPERSSYRIPHLRASFYPAAVLGCIPSSQSWANYTYYYDASDRFVNYEVNYDDGTKYFDYRDAANAYYWTLIAENYDATGVLKNRNQNNDDGTYSIGRYNFVTGQENGILNTIWWDYDIYYYNSAGRWTQHTYKFTYGDPITEYNNGPIILDLNGDGKIGVETLPEQVGTAGASFDWNGDGVRERSAWAGKGDAFLAIDLAADGAAGPDGKIDQGKELAFNLWGDGKNGVTSNSTDLEALRLVFDTNNDGVFDSSDTRWSEFRVWRDSNQNGTTEAGELLTLADAGITKIGLVSEKNGEKQLEDGSEIYGTSWFETAAGRRNLVGDVALVSRAEASVSSDRFPVTGDANSMPGNRRIDSLVAAMASFGANTSAGVTELGSDGKESIGTWRQDSLAASARTWSAA